MAEHTPGPWRKERPEHIHRQGPTGAFVIKAGDKVICQRLWAEGNPAAIREMEANGQLIIAAPDLLEACEAWVNHMDGPGDGTDVTLEDEERMIEAMRAAIAKAKARGRTENRP